MRRIVPLALPLLQLDHQLPQLAVLLQVFAELVGVLSLADLARHDLELMSDFLLLFLQGVESAHDLIIVAADHLLHLREVISDPLVLLALVQEAECALSQLLQVLVGVGEGKLVLMDQLADCLVRFLELG